MSTFDATSGAIDGLFAVAFYAAVLFGIRTFVHRRKGTQPNPANNKWMWLSVLGIGAAMFAAGGAASSAGTAASSTDPDRCVTIRSESTQYNAKMAAASSASDKNYVALQASYYVVNNAECFPATDVAAAQAFITRSK